jgi:hypothetical protein
MHWFPRWESSLRWLALLLAMVVGSGCIPGIREQIDSSIAEARAELHRDPLALQAESRPDAAITPAGEFTIAGEPVATDAGQQQALLDYRTAMIAYADAALEVTAEEAGPLATRATTWALIGLFTGSDEWADRRITADSARLEDRVRQLCPQLLRAWSAETELASVLPEFRPYAGLEQRDVSDCQADARI